MSFVMYGFLLQFFKHYIIFFVSFAQELNDFGFWPEKKKIKQDILIPLYLALGGCGEHLIDKTNDDDENILYLHHIFLEGAKVLDKSVCFESFLQIRLPYLDLSTLLKVWPRMFHIVLFTL